MRKLIPVFSVFLCALLITNCNSEKLNEKTVLGLFTPYDGFPETLNGKVKEVKELNYWAIESNGEITAGNPVTIADRDSISWTNDFIVSLDESGVVEKSTTINENGNAISYWEVKSEGGELISADRYENDTLRNKLTVVLKTETMNKMEVKDANADTLIYAYELEFDGNGNYSSVQLYNYRNEPTVKYEYNYSPEGYLSNYTWTRNDTIRGGMRFTHNDHGFAETQEVYSNITGASSLYNYEYKYDEMGNWIQVVASQENKPEIVAKRTYVYY